MGVALTMHNKDGEAFLIQIQTPYDSRPLRKCMKILPAPELYGAHGMSDLMPYPRDVPLNNSLQVIVAATYENMFYHVIVHDLDDYRSTYQETPILLF